MKKIFTLIATALVAMAANATVEWSVSSYSEGSIPEGTIAIDNSYAKISTANSDGNVMNSYDENGIPGSVTFAGETFSNYVGLRVTAAPSELLPTGSAYQTDDGINNIALVISAKANTDVTLYYRIGASKNIECYDQTAKEAVAITQTSYSETESVYLYCTGVYKCQAGHTYTVYSRGGTVWLFGANTAEGTYVAPTNKVYGFIEAANTVTYGDGAKMQITGNTAKNFGSATKINGTTSIKNSNGAQMTFWAPENKKVTSATFYFTANKDEEEAKLTEINGEKIEGVSAVGKIHANPTIYTYDFTEPTSTFTFTFTNKQCNFILDLTYGTADQTYADAVINKIKAIGTVDDSEACKALIDEARSAYNALTDDQKALVSNYETLTSAEAAYQAEISKYVTLTYTVAGQGGLSTKVKKGNVVLNIAPEEGWTVATLTLDGTDKLADLVNGKLTFNMQADTTVAVTYKWADEANLYTESDITTGIISTKAGVKAYVENGVINVESQGKDICIYTISGAKMASKTPQMAVSQFHVPAGTYIVKVGTEAIKLVVE